MSFIWIVWITLYVYLWWKHEKNLLQTLLIIGPFFSVLLLPWFAPMAKKLKIQIENWAEAPSVIYTLWKKLTERNLKVFVELETWMSTLKKYIYTFQTNGHRVHKAQNNIWQIGIHLYFILLKARLDWRGKILYELLFKYSYNY